MLLRLLKDSGWPAVTGKQVWGHFRCVPGLPAGRESSENKLVRHPDAPQGLPASRTSSENKLVRHPDAPWGLTAGRESSEIKLIAFPMTFLPLPGLHRHRDQKNFLNRCAFPRIQGKNVIGNSLFLKFADQHPRSRSNCQQKTSLFPFPMITTLVSSKTISKNMLIPLSADNRPLLTSRVSLSPPAGRFRTFFRDILRP